MANCKETCSFHYAFKTKLMEMTKAIKVGDPSERDLYMGTVINKKAYMDYQKWVEAARADATVLAGGHILTQGEFAKGFSVEPAIVEGLPEDHQLVRTELILPILHIAKVNSLEELMEKVNNTQYGLTAGFFGQEMDWFLDAVQAGTTYVNRASGATTGVWLGIQVFSSCKGSGSSGKGIGGLYTLALYMREQSRTIID